MEVVALILAAGASRRMKKTKQIMPWGNTTLLEHIVQTAHSADITRIYIVLGADHKIIQEKLTTQDISLIYNPEWELGQGVSLARGIAEIAENPKIDACLVLLADQPFITPAYLKEMIGLAHTGDIVASSYGQNPGVPCVFPRLLFDEIRHSEGDQGAKKVLLRHKLQLCYPASTPDLRDIDTPEQYDAYRDRQQ